MVERGLCKSGVPDSRDTDGVGGPVGVMRPTTGLPVHE